MSAYSGDVVLGGADYSQEYYLTSGSSPVAGTTFGMTAFEGYIDEVRVYRNKILSINEVRAIYLNPQAQTSNIIHGGQITAGIIKSLNSNATEGTILNLQEGEIHAGGSGSSARFLYDGSELRISASSFFVGSQAYISGSGQNIEISSSGFHLKRTGDAIFSGSITANDGTIGGFTITDEQIAIDNIKLSSIEKGLIISSSAGIGKVRVTSGSLSSTDGSITNHLSNPSFEVTTAETAISASIPKSINGWYFKNSQPASGVIELANSASVSMSIAASDTAVGSNHLKINIHRELGPAGEGEGEIPT